MSRRQARAASSSASRSSQGSLGAVPDGRSSTRPVRWPAAYAVETWTKYGSLPASRSAFSSRVGPLPLSSSASSSDCSKETEAAQWMTTSMSPTPSSPSLPRSPPTALTALPSRPSNGALVSTSSCRRCCGSSPRSSTVTRRVGQLADDLREHGLADEPRGTGQQQRLAGESVLQRRVEYLFRGQMGTVPPVSTNVSVDGLPGPHPGGGARRVRRSTATPPGCRTSPSARVSRTRRCSTTSAPRSGSTPR